MPKYVLSRRAVSDLGTIWHYTNETWSENQADKYYQLLVEGFEQIIQMPGKGRNYDEIEKGLKGLRVGKHVIFYLTTKTRVEIVRILHERMDLRLHFRS